MRVVLDTNIFISGLISKPGSVTQRVRKAWIEGKLDVCISEY
jgi:predicted nucleic acid-binding protein